MYIISPLGFTKLINYIVEKEENNEEIMNLLCEKLFELCDDYYLDINGENYHQIKKIYNKMPIQDNKNSYLIKIKNNDLNVFRTVFNENNLISNIFLNTYKKNNFVDGLYKNSTIRNKIIDLCTGENEKDKGSLLYLNSSKIFEENKIKNKEIEYNNYYHDNYNTNYFDRFRNTRHTNYQY
jgi:hypothetical protein